MTTRFKQVLSAYFYNIRQDWYIFPIFIALFGLSAYWISSCQEKRAAQKITHYEKDIEKAQAHVEENKKQITKLENQVKNIDREREAAVSEAFRLRSKIRPLTEAAAKAKAEFNESKKIDTTSSDADLAKKLQTLAVNIYDRHIEVIPIAPGKFSVDRAGMEIAVNSLSAQSRMEELITRSEAVTTSCQEALDKNTEALNISTSEIEKLKQLTIQQQKQTEALTLITEDQKKIIDLKDKELKIERRKNKIIRYGGIVTAGIVMAKILL